MRPAWPRSSSARGTRCRSRGRVRRAPAPAISRHVAKMPEPRCRSPTSTCCVVAIAEFSQRAAVDRASARPASRPSRRAQLGARSIRARSARQISNILQPLLKSHDPSIFLTHHAAAEPRRLLRLVILAEPVAEELFHRHLLLLHQARAAATCRPRASRAPHRCRPPW